MICGGIDFGDTFGNGEQNDWEISVLTQKLETSQYPTKIRSER